MEKLCAKDEVEDADIVTKRVAIKERIKIALQRGEKLSCNYLIQFWASIVIDGQTFLTTSDQPFGLTRLDEGLCSYRRRCLSHVIPIELKNGTQCENDLGPPGRVFKHTLPELCTDVRNYCQQEFPLRDDAIACGIQWCYTVPVSDPSRDNFVGVLELVTSHQTNEWIFGNSVLPIFKTLQVVDLKSPDSYGQLNLKVLDDQQHALGGLYKAIEMVCQKHQFLFAQVWVPVADSWCRGKAITIRQRHIAIKDNQKLSLFKYASGVQYILEGYGVVGRAFASKSSCFCQDVTQLSIMEYPLVTCAREAGLTGCFAICLSAPGNDENAYIVEFFLAPNELPPRSLQDLLKLVLHTVKQQLQSFKVAIGHDFGEKLLIEVIKISSSDELGSFEILKSTKELHNVEPLPNGGEMMLLDSPIQQPSLDIYEISAARDSVAVGGEQSYTAGSSPCSETSLNKEAKMQLDLLLQQPKEEANAVNKSRKKANVVDRRRRKEANAVNKRKNGKQTVMPESMIQEERKRIEEEYGINLEVLEKHACMVQDDAADAMEVSRATLKRICRLYYIPRWPPKKSVVKRSCSRQKRSILPNVNANTKFQQSSDSPTKEHTIDGGEVGVHVTEIQDDTAVIAKVKYGDMMLRLQLSVSSTKKDLEEEVAKRLDLSTGSFVLVYADEEGDMISICCDDDLKSCFLHGGSSGSTTIKLSVAPKS